MTDDRNSRAKIAVFVPNLEGGGAERVMLYVASDLAGMGYAVDLVLASAHGVYMGQVPDSVRVVDLKSPRVLFSLPALLKYLRRERPAALLSALSQANVVAAWAKRLAGGNVRTVLTMHNTLSLEAKHGKSLRMKMMPAFIRSFGPWADEIVAVSQGVADDLIDVIRLPRNKVSVIYNPVVSDEMLAKSCEPVSNPWFAEGQPPVILSVGRLNQQKNYEMLLRAFAKLVGMRQAVTGGQPPCRLMILGEGEERASLEALAGEVGLGPEIVSLPGFVENPFAVMRRAAVFALSSRHEGLPTVLIEALACGCGAVVSTDCPSGPAEILQGGKYGTLVPVGDVDALANALDSALTSVLAGRQPAPEASWSPFRSTVAAGNYRRMLVPGSHAAAQGEILMPVSEAAPNA